LWKEDNSCNWCGCINSQAVCTRLHCNQEYKELCIPGSVYLDTCGRQCTCDLRGQPSCQNTTCLPEFEVAGRPCSSATFFTLPDSNWCRCEAGITDCTSFQCTSSASLRPPAITQQPQLPQQLQPHTPQSQLTSLPPVLTLQIPRTPQPLPTGLTPPP
ncbi:hypothetical protein OTU49_012274, partial [Cherax quadricarinatus]